MATGTKAETPAQTIGAFLMMHNVAPWEADEILRWLEKDGFVIVKESDRFEMQEKAWKYDQLCK